MVCKAIIFFEQVPEYVVVHLNALTGEAILDLGELADVADVAEKITQREPATFGRQAASPTTNTEHEHQQALSISKGQF